MEAVATDINGHEYTVTKEKFLLFEPFSVLTFDEIIKIFNLKGTEPIEKVLTTSDVMDVHIEFTGDFLFEILQNVEFGHE